MPPTVKDTELASSETSTRRPAASGNPQTVALDVPVTVNGVRPVEHSDKREPFVEATKTVLVHSAGAVIRLASAVVPGQLLFLTNDKTKKEVVCQVVKSKSHGDVSGYVELEFTEPVQGFWGLGFPAERAPGVTAAARPAVLSPLGQNIDSRPAVSNVVAKPTEPSAAVLADEFKTEIKQDSRSMSKADFLAPADSSTQALKIDTERLQEQLSTLVFADAVTDEAPRAAAKPSSGADAGALSDATARIFEIAANEPTLSKAEARSEREEPAASVIPAPKAPVSSTPAFEAEEVKIPAWLQPLARNAAIPAPPEPAANLSASSPSDSSSSGTSATTSSASTSEFEELSAAEPQRQAAPAPTTHATVPTKRAAVPVAAPAPVFGRTLLGATAAAPAKAPRSNKAMLITAIAAGIVLAAAGATWYLRQPSDPAANSGATNSSALGTPAATLPTTTAPSSTASSSTPSSNTYTGTEGSSPEAKPNSPASGADVRPVSSSSAGAKQQPASISERVPKPAAAVDASGTPSSSEEVEPEAQRPSLGRVRLAKPKVGHSARATLNGDAAPALEADSEQLPTGDSPLSSGLLAGNANQPAAPAAPTPVGGDVATARLISSVPPAYPALARTQHIQGDVRVDALIGANGRVTSMKVISGPTLLHQAAMDALHQWKYQPATLDGKPVAMRLTVTIQFHLQ
jgi:TonB family protein